MEVHIVGVFYSNFATICHPKVDCNLNIFSLNQVSNLSLSSCQVELVSHAKTCGVNSVAKISYTGKAVQVLAYSPNSIEKLESIPIVSAAVVYDEAVTDEAYIIIINQALYFGQNLRNTLLNPNQFRVSVVQVEKAPKHPTQAKSSLSIRFPEEDVSIPWQCMVACHSSHFTLQRKV